MLFQTVIKENRNLSSFNKFNIRRPLVRRQTAKTYCETTCSNRNESITFLTSVFRFISHIISLPPSHRKESHENAPDRITLYTRRRPVVPLLSARYYFQSARKNALYKRTRAYLLIFIYNNNIRVRHTRELIRA